jgi:hypothetical protein
MLMKYNSPISALLFHPVKTFQLDVRDSLWNE